jgi:RNA polymerase sigma factor (TIGR02999 family)
MENREVTQLLEAWRAGDAKAGDELMRIVHAELRRIAAQHIRNGRRNGTLGPTELVHEAYIRLVGQRQPWNSRIHFYAVAAKAMRQVLVDHARRRQTIKRGGMQERVPFSEDLESIVVSLPAGQDGIEADKKLLALDDALMELERLNPEHAKIVELRFFGELTVEETALQLGLSSPTIKRHWAMARAWLNAEIRARLNGHSDTRRSIHTV